MSHDDAGFRLDRAYDLASIVAPPGRDDALVTVLPDWSGRWFWFTTRLGMVGTVERETGVVQTHQLDGERIQNSFAVGTDGAFIVSDHALYAFAADPSTGAPKVTWRAQYDRGTHRKLGQIDQGSGTTPTLLGDEFVAIADNAEPRLNVLVYRRGPIDFGQRRGSERLICKQPLFAPGASATDNSFIGIGRSLVIENNAGYDIFPTMMFGKTSAGGVARVDIDDEGHRLPRRLGKQGDLADDGGEALARERPRLPLHEARERAVVDRRVLPHRGRLPDRRDRVQRAHRHRRRLRQPLGTGHDRPRRHGVRGDDPRSDRGARPITHRGVDFSTPANRCLTGFRTIATSF